MIIQTSSELRWDFTELGEYFYDLFDNYVNVRMKDLTYSNNINRVFILLICNSGTSNYRIRKKVYTDAEKGDWIGIDCIIPISKAMLLTEKELRIYLLDELKLTVQSLVTLKKKVKDFDFERFISDVCCILDEKNLLENVE